MRVISILNFKGGTGKSSLAENLSHALALQGRRVLVIDADRQGNSSTTLLGNDYTPTLTNVLKEQTPLDKATWPTLINGVWVVPSDTNLDSAFAYLTGRRSAYYSLRKQVQTLAGFEYVLIDQAGSYTPVMEACLLASTEMLVPCEMESYAVQGLFSMFAKLEDALPDHEIRNAGIIPYNVDMRYAMARQYHSDLRGTFGQLVTAPIRTDSTVPRAQSMRQTVFVYDPHSRAAADFRTLAEDLIEMEVSA